MSDSITDRVTEILADAERGSDELGALEGIDDLPTELEDSGLFETAEEASELIEDEDAEALLAALGLDEFEDGTEPDSLPEAVALGDEEQVGDLRVLVKLAKVAGSDDADLESEVGELREVLDGRIGSDDEEDGGSEADDGDAGEDDESLAESAADAVQEAVGDDGSEDGDDEGLLEEAMRSKLEGFGEELDEARAHLDSLRDEEGDADEADKEDVDDEESKDDEADDGGPLGSDSRPRSRGTMHSTMAPSPSERADMGRSTRHSTMPDR